MVAPRVVPVAEQSNRIRSTRPLVLLQVALVHSFQLVIVVDRDSRRVEEKKNNRAVCAYIVKLAMKKKIQDIIQCFFVFCITSVFVLRNFVTYASINTQ